MVCAVWKTLVNLSLDSSERFNPAIVVWSGVVLCGVCQWKRWRVEELCGEANGKRPKTKSVQSGREKPIDAGAAAARLFGGERSGAPLLLFTSLHRCTFYSPTSFFNVFTCNYRLLALLSFHLPRLSLYPFLLCKCLLYSQDPCLSCVSPLTDWQQRTVLLHSLNSLLDNMLPSLNIQSLLCLLYLQLWLKVISSSGTKK